jgi:plastocyanin
MLNFTNFFKQSPQNKLSLKNNTQLAYKGSWVQIYPDTEIDRWYVGDYSSANYTITAEFDSNKKEVLQVLVVARPDQATVTVYGRTSIDDSLINISASVNNSYVSIIVNVTDTTFLGTKVIFFANYAETITPLAVAQDTSFIDSSLGGGYDGGGGSIGAAASFSQLSGTIGLSQISNGLITPVKLNLNASLIPTANETFDLGSSTFRWRDLYLSGSSIQLGSATITASGSSIVLPVGTTVGGTAINSFATVAVSGQSNVVADNASDTLTLVAGPGIELTTNAGTDTVTITNTGGGGGGGGSGVSSGTANRLTYYASNGSVVQDTGANLTWNGTTLAVTGTITASGAVSYVRAYFDTLAELTAVSAATWHGMVAHVHETGRMYFAHAGAWAPLANFSDLNYFSTIAVAGQSNVVADSATDTLTLVGAGGITITTNAGTDTITITGSGGVGTLDSLSDVVITGTPTNGQVLKYDSGTNTWVNGTDATGGGGGSSNSFETIAVAGQSNVVADSATDTLTLVAGTGITITTTSGTDTITIASTVSGGATAFTGLTDRSDLTVDQFYLPAITRLVVTANGSSAYRFDQYSTTDNPTIYAISGTTIAFDLNNGLGSHPFLIRFSGANYNTGLVHVTSAGVVTTGSNAQGKTSGTLYWKIPAGINGTYGYLCSNHGSMAGTITIKDISAI